jgi:NTP pyrophosphatase (non-canonical NTP hydrolase)
MPKTLQEMTAEVEACNRANGWYDTDVPFYVALALLHEEVAEAGHAWREHGLADVTCRGHVHTHGYGDKLDKPEGVGSEFADIFIRLLDASARYKVDLEEYVEDDPEIFAVDDEFLVNINMLHRLIAGVSVALETRYRSSDAELAGVLAFLRQLCGHYGIDLTAEYERKLAYNRTRPYRHGGRRA